MKIVNIYFSTSGESAKIAEYFQARLNCLTIDLTSLESRKKFDYSIQYDLAILSFPVHCQNIPFPFKAVLLDIKANYFIINITYGKMSFGNVLFETKKKLNGIIIGASIIPTKHTYLKNCPFNNLNQLNLLVERRFSTKEISIPKFKKNIFASIFPKIRSRIGIKLKKTEQCQKCNLCTSQCPTQAIICGSIYHHKCIRCLKCYYICPHKGLTFKVTKPLKYYLNNEKTSKLYIY